jgi:hypothetical protein
LAYPVFYFMKLNPYLGTLKGEGNEVDHVRPGTGPWWRRRARQERPGESLVGWPAVEFAGESSLKPFAPIRSYRREEDVSIPKDSGGGALPLGLD